MEERILDHMTLPTLSPSFDFSIILPESQRAQLSQLIADYHQYVEKTLKDALEITTSEIRRGHNLVTLLGELAEGCGASGADGYDDVESMCKRLTKHYYDARYPDDRTFVQKFYTVDDARQAVEDAEHVVEWMGRLEVLEGVLYKDSWSVRRGTCHGPHTIADTSAYRRTVSEYSRLLRIR